MSLRSPNLLFSAAAELRAIVTASSPTHRHLRDRIVTLVVVSVVVDLVCAGLALWFEKGGPQSEISGFGDALFWASTQLLSVSSSLKDPVTGAGEVLDVFMELYAITVVTALAGSFASFLHRRSKERDDLADAARKRAAHPAIDTPS